MSGWTETWASVATSSLGSSLRQFHVNIIVFIVRFIVKFFRNSLSGKLYVFLIDHIVNTRNGTFLVPAIFVAPRDRSMAKFRISSTISKYFNRNIRNIEYIYIYTLDKYKRGRGREGEEKVPFWKWDIIGERRGYYIGRNGWRERA